MTETKYIGVQFNKLGKVYHFSVPAELIVKSDDYVIVNNARGKQIGRVLHDHVNKPVNNDEIQSIERIADDEDKAIKEVLSQKEAEAVDWISMFLQKSQFEGVKIVDAEYSFDSTRLTLFLNYETDAKFDIRAFLKDISHNFKDSRIEVRQIGPRDMAKVMSGLGACGIEERCCSRFLAEFSSISIKMAKSQDISLTPGEITGICGRLRCCLLYEYDMYEEARKNLPKRKKVVKTPLGEGKVVQVLPLSEKVIVELPELGQRKFSRTELETGVMETREVLPDALIFPESEEYVEIVHIEQTRPNPKPEGYKREQKSSPPRRQPSAGRGQQGNRRDDRSSQSNIKRRQDRTQKNQQSEVQSGGTKDRSRRRKAGTNRNSNQSGASEKKQPGTNRRNEGANQKKFDISKSPINPRDRSKSRRNPRYARNSMAKGEQKNSKNSTDQQPSS